MENNIITQEEVVNNAIFEAIVREVKVAFTMQPEKIQEVIDNIRARMKKYIIDNKLEALIVGVSGGLDSAIISALFQEKYTGVPLIGISIPMSSTNAHKEQAQWVGDTFCTVFEEFVDWDDKWTLDGAYTEGNFVETNMYQEVLGTVSMTDRIAKKAGFNSDNFPTSVLDGNVKARLRMITLYDLARKTNGIVLSTDNFSEFNMGFWTLCGDVGDVGAIQNINKGMELPQIARALNVREDIIIQPPSDGLMVTEDNTDEAQLGASYEEVDAIMYCYEELKSDRYPDELEKGYLMDFVRLYRDEDYEKIVNIINRYKGTQYKRNGTYNFSREEIGLA